MLYGAAEEAGLDADAMQREVESGKYQGILGDEVDGAYALGINAVPTCIKY